MKRCSWLNLKNPLYVEYHDKEWGVIKHCEKHLFETLILECFQAGLSWECILNKREDFRKSFDNFDIDKICSYNNKKINELLDNPNIIRNKLKIKATINNAKIFKQIQNEFSSFEKYIEIQCGTKPIIEDYAKQTKSELSDKLSKDLKKRGMKFVGSVTVYSYLQAIGIINGHGKECFLNIKNFKNCKLS